MINAVQCNELQQRMTPQKKKNEVQKKKIPSFTKAEDSICMLYQEYYYN